MEIRWGGGSAFHGFLVWKLSMTNAPGCGNIIFTTAGIFLAAHRQAKMGCVKRCQFDSGIISGHLPANVFPETQQGSGFSPECRQQGARFPGTSPWKPFRLRKRSAPALTADVTAGKVRKRKRRRGGGSCRKSRAFPPIATPLLDASQADFPGNESEVQADLGRFSKQAIHGPAGFHSRVLATTFTRLAAPRLS